MKTDWRNTSETSLKIKTRICRISCYSFYFEYKMWLCDSLLILSPIIFYFIFFIRLLGENSKHWVRAAWFTPARPLYSSFCSFCSVKNNFVFLCVFKLSLATTIGVDPGFFFQLASFNHDDKGHGCSPYLKISSEQNYV